MTKFFDIVAFAAELKAIDRDLHELGPHIVERACQMVQKKAKAAIGREHEMWPALAPSTLQNKQANTPLLETGEMRDSIQYVVHGNEAVRLPCTRSSAPRDKRRWTRINAAGRCS